MGAPTRSPAAAAGGGRPASRARDRAAGYRAAQELGRLHWPQLGFTGPRLSIGGVDRETGLDCPVGGIGSGRRGSPGTGGRGAFGQTMAVG